MGFPHACYEFFVSDQCNAKVVPICHVLPSVPEHLDLILIIVLVVVEGNHTSLKPPLLKPTVHHLLFIKAFSFCTEGAVVVFGPYLRWLRLQELEDRFFRSKLDDRGCDALQVVDQRIDTIDGPIIFERAAFANK